MGAPHCVLLFVASLISQAYGCQPTSPYYGRSSNYYAPQQSYQPAYQYSYNPSSVAVAPLQPPPQYPTLDASPPLDPPADPFVLDNGLMESNINDVSFDVAGSSNIRPVQAVPPLDESNHNAFTEDKKSDVAELNNDVLDDSCSRMGAESLTSLLECIDANPYFTNGVQARLGGHKCDFEPEFVCRFYTSPRETLKFQTGDFHGHGSPILEESFNLLVNRSGGIMPDHGFIFVEARNALEPNVTAVLRADVECQTGDGTLSFDYWATNPNIMLKVCTRTLKEHSCTENISYDTEASRVEIDVIKPAENPFVVEIVVSNFAEPSAFFLDSLEYEANSCASSAGAVPLPTTTTFPLARQLVHGAQLLPQTYPIEPSLNHLQHRPGFGHSNGYVTPPSPHGGLSRINIQPFTRPANFVPSRVQNNATPEPPKNQEGLAHHSDGIDFVRAGYKVNNKANERVSQKSADVEIKKKRLGIAKLQECAPLDCDFENGLCKYTFTIIKNSNVRYGKWQLSRSLLASPTNKSAGHGSFAFVGMDKKSPQQAKGRTVYILESPLFNLDAPAKLTFDVYRRSNAIDLQVCIDSLTNCPYESPPIRGKADWRHGESVILPATTRKIFFIATQWKKFKWLAIDNVKLHSASGCSSVV